MFISGLNGWLAPIEQFGHSTWHASLRAHGRTCLSSGTVLVVTALSWLWFDYQALFRRLRIHSKDAVASRWDPSLDSCNDIANICSTTNPGLVPAATAPLPGASRYHNDPLSLIEQASNMQHANNINTGKSAVELLADLTRRQSTPPTP